MNFITNVKGHTHTKITLLKGQYFVSLDIFQKNYRSLNIFKNE